MNIEAAKELEEQIEEEVKKDISTISILKDEKLDINELDFKDENNNELIEEDKKYIATDESKDNEFLSSDSESLTPKESPNKVKETVCCMIKWIFESRIGRDLFPPLRVKCEYKK